MTFLPHKYHRDKMSSDINPKKAALLGYLNDLKIHVKAEADLLIPIINQNNGRCGAPFCSLLFSALDVLAFLVCNKNQSPNEQPERLRRFFTDSRFMPRHFLGKNEIMMHLFRSGVVHAFQPSTGPIVRTPANQAASSPTFVIQGQVLINPTKFLEDVLGIIAKVSTYLDFAPEAELGLMHARMEFKESHDKDQFIKLVTGLAFEEMPTMGGG
jgi:hypothetical protein